MPTFAFIARDSDGREQTGVQSAPSPAAVAGDLRNRGWIVVDLQSADDALAVEVPRRSWNPLRLLPATRFDVEVGLQQIAAMLDSGLTLLTALGTAAEQARRPRMGEIWADVRDRISEGSTFADALARHGRLFPPLVVQLARAGEQSGTLETVLEQAAGQLERLRSIRNTMMSALIYPAIVTFLAVAVGAFMLLHVIPQLEPLLAAFNRTLPPITVALLDVSHWLQDYAPNVSIGFGIAIIVIVVLRRSPAAALGMDRIVLRLPVIGKLLRLAGTAMFARALGMLLENGVALLDALKTAGPLLSNTAMSERVRLTRESVLGGGTLARTLQAGAEFLPMLSRMVAVGEETGTLGTVLEKSARFHEAQLAGAVKRLSILIEPVVTLVVGGIVGFVYLAFFMAMYSFAGGGGD